MKKFLIPLLTIVLLSFVSCKKDNENDQGTTPQFTDYAAAFIGTYNVHVDASMTLPVLGETSIPLNDLEGTCTRVDGNDVKLTMGSMTLEGYANASGLHVDPFVVNREIANYTLAITVAVPVVSAPVNGVVQGTASLSASIAGTSIYGTADYTATKKN